jgi:hypothetical protein
VQSTCSKICLAAVTERGYESWKQRYLVASLIVGVVGP